MAIQQSIIQRFQSVISPEPMSGCWLWAACADRLGYGQWRFDGRIQKAHRVAWQLYRAPIPNGLLVLHRCDVPSCVNPDHLWLGTQADNVADMIAKERQRHDRNPRGEHNGRAKLTESDVQAIRASSESQHVCARRFGVGSTAIANIRRGKRWKQ